MIHSLILIAAVLSARYRHGPLLRSRAQRQMPVHPKPSRDVVCRLRVSLLCGQLEVEFRVRRLPVDTQWRVVSTLSVLGVCAGARVRAKLLSCAAPFSIIKTRTLFNKMQSPETSRVTAMARSNNQASPPRPPTHFLITCSSMLLMHCTSDSLMRLKIAEDQKLLFVTFPPLLNIE